MKDLNIISNYRGLPKSIYAIFLASLVNNFGNFVMLFLAMYLTYNVRINVAVVGLIVSMNSGFGMLGALIGGKLIDTRGRKRTFVIFRTISALSIASCAFIKNPIIVTGLLMASTFFGSFTSPVYSTMITDLTEGNQRKVAFSLEYMAMNIGFPVGSLVAAFLYNNYITWLFLGDALTTFISIIIVAALVPETLGLKNNSTSKDKKNKLEREEAGGLWTAFFKRKTLVVFSIIIIIYFIVFSQFNFGLTLQLGDVFKENKTWAFGILMAINGVMCSVFTPIIVSFSKNISSSLTISIGGVFYAIGFGMMFFINGFYMFVLSTIIWTAGEILVANNTSVYIASHTPESHRGRFNSIFPMIRKLGFLLGPAIAGNFVAFSSIRNLWAFVGVLALIGSFMMYRLYIFDKNQSDDNVVEALKEGI